MPLEQLFLISRSRYFAVEHGLRVMLHWWVNPLVAALARLDDNRALCAHHAVAARASIGERFRFEDFARPFARLHRQIDCASRTGGNYPAVGSTKSDAQA